MILKKYKFLILIGVVSLFFSSCGTVKKAFSNSKKNGSDEFLVEKKSPLVMPPDYNELPIPQSEKDKNQNEKSNIKKLITKNENDNNQDDKIDNINQNIEETILKKIKKN